ncbi:MAG TPA: hypothetical protein VFL93_09340 [Longimicrobiaceae bacterium]|nr:hypothetical protein [Longimicrobiaceae bacterium]
MKRPGCLVLLLLLLPLAACDPCFGTNACTGTHVDASGRLFWHLDDSPAAGTRVIFHQTGGDLVLPDSLVAVADENGVFHLRADVPKPGEAVGTLTFRPPEPWKGWDWGVSGVRFTTADVRGDMRYLGLWGVGPIRTDPHVSCVAEIFYEDTGERAVGVAVEFHRTGGLSAEPDTIREVSNEVGRFPLFMSVPGAGDVVGDLIVHAEPPYRPLVVHDVHLPTTVARDYVQLIGVWGIERD